jgi:hypothetical protein
VKTLKKLAREIAALTLTCIVLVTVGFGGMSTMSGCSWWNKNVKPVGTDVINCAEAEAKAAGSGADVIQAVDAILTNIAEVATAVGTGNLAAIWAALAPDVATYGEPVVACVFRDLAGSGAGSGSAAISAADEDPTAAFAKSMIAFRGWKFSK